jgi:hypothetical protein
MLRNNIYWVTNLKSPSECGIPRITRTQTLRCGNTFDDQWHMTLIINICYKSSMCHKCDIQECATVWQNVTLWHKKMQKYKKCQLGNEIGVTHFDTILHLYMSVTPKSSNSKDLLMTAEGTVGALLVCLQICKKKYTQKTFVYRTLSLMRWFPNCLIFRNWTSSCCYCSSLTVKLMLVLIGWCHSSWCGYSHLSLKGCLALQQYFFAHGRVNQQAHHMAPLMTADVKCMEFGHLLFFHGRSFPVGNIEWAKVNSMNLNVHPACVFFWSISR